MLFIRIFQSMRLFCDYYISSNGTFKMLNVIRFEELLVEILMFMIYMKKLVSFSTAKCVVILNSDYQMTHC